MSYIHEEEDKCQQEREKEKIHTCITYSHTYVLRHTQ
jgi:hypothetical protein